MTCLGGQVSCTKSTKPRMMTGGDAHSPIPAASICGFCRTKLFLFCVVLFSPREGSGQALAGSSFLWFFFGGEHRPCFTFWLGTDEVQVFSLTELPRVLILTLWNLCIYIFVWVLTSGLYGPCFKLAVAANSWSAVNARFISKENIVKQDGGLVGFFRSLCPD